MEGRGGGGSYTSSQDRSSQLSNQIKIVAVLSEAMGKMVPKIFGFEVPAHF